MTAENRHRPLTGLNKDHYADLLIHTRQKAEILRDIAKSAVETAREIIATTRHLKEKAIRLRQDLRSQTYKE